MKKQEAEFLELASKVRALAGEWRERDPEACVFSQALEAKALAVSPAPDLPPPSSALRTSADPQPPFAADLPSFRDQIRGCLRCPLGAGRGSFVFGEGNPRAELVFVGEAPGAEEDQQGRPFVGAAGQLLTRILAAMGLGRGDVYIMNVLKCRPPLNRDPESAEVEACRPFLEHQLKLLSPKVICALGRYATQALLRTEEGIGKLRGRFHEYQGIPVLPTYHPAALLRNEALKREVWEDMKLVLKRLGH